MLHMIFPTLRYSLIDIIVTLQKYDVEFSPPFEACLLLVILPFTPSAFVIHAYAQNSLQYRQLAISTEFRY